MPVFSTLGRRLGSLVATYPILVGGAALAALVLPLHGLGGLTEQLYRVEREIGLALVPAFVVLIVAVIFHFERRQQAALLRAATVSAREQEARAHAGSLERLVVFAGRVTRALDILSLRRVLEDDLPRLAGDHDAFVALRLRDRLDTLIYCHPGSPQMSSVMVERLALRAQQEAEAHPPVPGVNGGTFDLEGFVCVLLEVDRHTVGVIGLRAGTTPVTDDERRLLAASGSLIGIATRNAEHVRETREVGLRDGLTGCANRTHGLEALGVEMRRSLRSRATLSILLFDIDHFKAINDQHGHLCGDAVLASVGRVLHEQLRASDLKCRYGGEEFLVLLPETPLAAAATVAESLRSAFEAHVVKMGQVTIRFTVSFGVASMLPSDTDVASMVGRADAALYEAKHDGRNRVVTASEFDPGPAPPLHIVRRPAQLRLQSQPPKNPTRP